MRPLELYIHIPFCVKKCRYCDFLSAPATPEARQEYVIGLCQKIRSYYDLAGMYHVSSIFIGGGTPSILETQQMRSIFDAIRATFPIDSDAEITVEVNPGTVDKLKLMAYRNVGINRLSIGLQSTDDQELKMLGRIHTYKDFLDTYTLAREVGFQNINVDLMSGIPFQTLGGWEDTLKKVAELGPEHISAYSLIIEEGTPFWEQRKFLALPDEDSEGDMYFTAVSFMKQNGYMQYEISNFARKNHVCRHNLRYWNADEYIGFGAAAHSYFAGKRFSFKKNAKLYTDALCSENPSAGSIIDEYIDIPPSARIAEYVMLRFRLNKGIDKEKFRMRFGRDFDSVYYNRLRPFIQSGHIVETPKGYAFSLGGMYVSNYILSRVVDFDLVIPGLDQ